MVKDTQAATSQPAEKPLGKKAVSTVAQGTEELWDLKGWVIGPICL